VVMVHRLFTANHAFKRMGPACITWNIFTGISLLPGIAVRVSDSVTSKSYMHGMQFAVFFFARRMGPWQPKILLPRSMLVLV
jgi:hypothetical protein